MIVKIQWHQDGKVYEAGIMQLIKELDPKITEKQIEVAAKKVVRKL